MNSRDISRYRRLVQEETDAAYIYTQAALISKESAWKGLFSGMAAAESRHAALYTEKFTALGGKNPPRTPAWRARTLALIGRLFGLSVILPILAAGEESAVQEYSGMDEKAVAEEEAAHGAVLYNMLGRPEQDKGRALTDEKWHKSRGGNALRAAVMGANDGLVSNLSLVMGVAGASLPPRAILITGLAGLLAGAASMALGEWLSVQSARELYKHQIKLETDEIRDNPEEELEELRLIYQAKGLSARDADRTARKILSNPGKAVDTLAREELGLDPDELGGSAWKAAAVSFILFAMGAIIPVAPFFFINGWNAVLLSLSLSAAGLFILGAGITLYTGRGALFSGGRQVLFGLSAAALTFGIGKLLGISVAG